MDIDEIKDKLTTFAGTPAGKISLGIVAIGTGVLIVRKVRGGSTPAGSGSGTYPAGAIGGSAQTPATGSGSPYDSATAQIEAQAKAQTDILAAQTEQQKQLATFSLGLANEQAKQTLLNQTAAFDAQYGGTSADLLSLAGVGSINQSGVALGTTNSPRTAPVPVSGSGLEYGLPSEAGKSVLQSIADALGLTIANGESRASVLARLQGYQATQQFDISQKANAAADASYIARLNAQASINSQALDAQYQQQQNLLDQQRHAQEVANNPFSSIGNFLKTGLGLAALFRSTPQPTTTTTTAARQIQPLTNSPGEYAQLEAPVKNSVLMLGSAPTTPTGLFAGVA